MKDWFVLYIGMLAVVSICEMLIPKGKLEKSVKNALRVIFATAVFVPLLDKISAVDFNTIFSKTVASYQLPTVVETENQLFDEIIVGEYTSALSQTLLSKYKQSGRSNVIKVKVSVHSNITENDYVSIDSVNVYVNEKNYDVNDLVSFAQNFYNDYSVNINIIYDPAEDD